MSEDQKKPPTTPSRMWYLARMGIEHGWRATIYRKNDRWRLVLADPHHCIHLDWELTDHAQWPWSLCKKNLATRCPNGVGTKVGELIQFMADHPGECVLNHNRPPIAELHPVDGCEDHHVPAGR